MRKYLLILLLSFSAFSQSSLIAKQNFSYKVSASFDADAQAFITATGITDVTQKNSINTLVTSLKSNSLWSKFYLIYPFVGGTAFTHKFNLKDPRDLDVAFRLVYIGINGHDANGYSASGGGYSDTKLVHSTVTTLNDMAMSFYTRTNTTTAVDIFGARAGGSSSVRWILKDGATSRTAIDFNGDANRLDQNIVSDSRGFFTASRTSLISLKAYRNGAQIGTTYTTVNAGTQPNMTSFLSALNNSGTAVNVSTQIYSFVGISSGLSDAEASTLYTIVQTYQTELGRNL